MNILFYTGFEVSPLQGGTERITSSVANSLIRNYGWKVFSVFSVSKGAEMPKTRFTESLRIDNKHFVERTIDFICRNDIDVIINQSSFDHTRFFREAINKSGKDCKLVFCHHFNPGSEEHFVSVRGLKSEFSQRKRLKTLVKLVLYPFLKLRHDRTLRKGYRNTLQLSDCVVLLSANFKEDFLRYAQAKDNGKIRIIHNSLSFDTFFKMDDFGKKKKKQALIVARLDEPPKKISRALKIWKRIERLPSLRDWNLLIVGDGPDRPCYERYVSRHKLKRVSFEGMQAPQPYYEESSIFMMVSAWEGWGLTLTEAQQFGCVPLAFHSYKSLTDIITDGENGFVIPDDDMDSYIEKMKLLMMDETIRARMAGKAVASSLRFDMKSISKEWHTLLQEVVNKG